MDDIDRLRARQDESDDDATRSDGSDDLGSPAVAGKTTTAGTYPTAAAAYYLIIPQDVTGAEAEGAAGTVTATSGSFKALNIGPGVPPSGTTVICRFVPFRWVFRYG